jgi:4'-phosphopantetheinyl transferase
MIKIWYCSIRDFCFSDIDTYLKLIPVSLQQEISRYKSNDDRYARLAGKLLLRKALLDTGYGEELLSGWTRGENNKPFINNFMPFNIAHSEDLVVLAFGGSSQLGVDIELIDRKKDLSSLMSMLNPEEKEWINKNNNHPAEGFFNLWVRKEAVLKADGIGALGELTELDCANERVAFNEHCWYLNKLSLHAQYVCYLACADASCEVSLKEFAVSDLG